MVLAEYIINYVHFFIHSLKKYFKPEFHIPTLFQNRLIFVHLFQLIKQIFNYKYKIPTEVKHRPNKWFPTAEYLSCPVAKLLLLCTPSYTLISAHVKFIFVGAKVESFDIWFVRISYQLLDQPPTACLLGWWSAMSESTYYHMANTYGSTSIAFFLALT